MIRLGLRLTLQSGGDSARRVIVTAAAVALGVGLLLTALAGVNALHMQTERGAWLNTSPETRASGKISRDPLWWQLSIDQFGSQAIDRVDVAATGPSSPVPPGLPRLPAAGQYFASPALERLLASLPPNQLADRYPGREVGIIGSAGLTSPNSLIVVVGDAPTQLSQQPGAFKVRGIQRTLSNCYACQSGVGSGPVLQWILAVGAVALLLPVLILIATASRLSAARREERFAAMRLVGAMPRQISVISAVEAAVAAIAGVALGFVLFFLFRPLLYNVPFTGAPFAPGDLSLSWTDALVVVIGVPIAAIVSARIALRRVQVSPLGVSRRVSSPPPRIFRIIPLLTGIGVLAYFDAKGKPGANGAQLLELLVCFVLISIGLVLAGPWFTTAGSRLMARRANRPAALIAGRRLLDNPRAAFRFVSGLVLALFVTSAIIGALSSILALTNSNGGSAGRDTVADLFCSYSHTGCPASTKVASVTGRVLSELRSTPGVRSVTMIHQDLSSNPFGGVVTCNQLARTPAIGRCAPGASTARVEWILQPPLGNHSTSTSTIWPGASLSVASVARLPVDAVVVATDGSAGAIERARTSLERAFPTQGEAVVVEAQDPATSRFLAMIQDMADVVIVASLVIAACSLAVSVAAGLGERKRPFSVLRLTGVPTSVLQKVVTLESAIPLLLIAAVAIVVGLVSAALFLRSQAGIAFHMPGPGYWVTVAAGLAASLAVIASTFPLLNKVTGPDAARNE